MSVSKNRSTTQTAQASSTFLIESPEEWPSPDSAQDEAASVATGGLFRVLAVQIEIAPAFVLEEVATIT